jgi:subtilisin-like proprotein convertase family protein
LPEFCSALRWNTVSGTTLHGPGNLSATLWDRSGGTTNDLHLSNINEAGIAAGRNGTWTLRVEDLAAGDTGSLTGFKLNIW